MCHNPVTDESELDPAAVVSVVIDSFKHTIKSLKGKEPPPVDRSEELDEFDVVHRQVMINCGVDSKTLQCAAILSNKVLTNTSLGHGNMARSQYTNGSTKREDGSVY